MAASSEDAAFREAEGIPAPHDPFIKQFMQGRDKLVFEEKKKRSDNTFRANLSNAVKEAGAIVDAIRLEEHQTVWIKEYGDTFADKDQDVYPGMSFSLAKQRMEKSKLFQIVRKMPKGALLHCHIEAMVDFDWAIQEAMETSGFCIEADGPLNSSTNRLRTAFRFFHQKGVSSEKAGLWTEAYVPKTPVNLVDAAKSFPDGGKHGFIEWVRSRVTITPDESLKHHYGIDDVWRKFLSCFPILGSIIYYEPIFRRFLARMFKELLDDGVQWVELRSAFYTPFFAKDSEEPDSDHMGFFRCLDEELAKFQDSKEGENFWGARVIWTTVRAFDTPEIIEGMKECISIKKKYPDLICGYDLVGQEDAGRTLKDLTPELFWFSLRCLEEGLEIPFFFHAGETLGDGDSTDENLFDAIAWKTRRIGHGFSLYKHPLLIDMVKEQKILIESCPVSNEVLRLCSSIKAHPLPALLARGVPCSLSNDDPTILGHGVNGMTHDFWQALQGWHNLGLVGLGSLAENSVRWAAFDDCNRNEWLQDIKLGITGDTFKAECLKDWTRQWERFCQWIVTEYGPD